MFRLGNLNPVVKATKRGYGSVTVAPPANVTFSCMPVGELSDAMYTEPDPLGGTRYCLPEGTLLSVQVAQVSAGPEEWCTRGPLVLSECVGGGSTSHASTRALIHPTGVRVSGGACCCDDDDWFCFCGLPSSPQYHIFDGGPGGLIFTSRQVLDMYSDDLYFQGGSVTVCSSLAGWGDPTAPQTIYFEMKAYTGYQHLYTVVYNEDGEYVDTVYPARGLRDTTSIETSCAEGRLCGLAETVQQPTLKVDIEVEGNLVPAAVAGHFTFPKPDGCAGARKYYTCAHERPDPKSDIATELIAVTAVPHEGFCHERWKGEGPVYDEYGNERTDVALDAREDEPERWVTDKTIYLKCLENEDEQVAWAMSDMAALAGAAVKGALSGGSKPASRRVTSKYVAKYGVLIRGGGFEPPTKFLKTVPKLRFYKDANAGYSVSERDKNQLFTLSKAIDVLRRESVELFAFVGHGLPSEPRIVVSSKYDISLSPDDVNGKMLSPFSLLFFNSCCQARYKNEWMEAFESKSFVGWKTVVYGYAAEAFDIAFWDFLAHKVDEEPDVYLAYYAAERAIEGYIKKGVHNEPDYGGDYTFPGRVN